MKTESIFQVCTFPTKDLIRFDILHNNNAKMLLKSQ